LCAGKVLQLFRLESRHEIALVLVLSIAVLVLVLDRTANLQNIASRGTFPGRSARDFDESILVFQTLLNVESFLVESRFWHDAPFEYEYRCTEYESVCPEERLFAAIQEFSSTSVPMIH